MPKRYLILNFSDYKASTESTIRTIGPFYRLNVALGSRVSTKGYIINMFHMSDMLAGLRIQIKHGQLVGHEMEGLLDSPSIVELCAQAPIRIRRDWTDLMVQVANADKIVFAAHGRKDDTDNVYCEHNKVTYRCGNVNGITFFLKLLLNMVRNARPTITLVVCYGARTAQHQKHHVSDTLSQADIQSSLAYKIFVRLVDSKPGVRLTARTGAMEGVEASLVSETEEAIIASEQRRRDFPGGDEEEVLGTIEAKVNAVYSSLGQSNLSRADRQQFEGDLYDWYTSGCNPGLLGPIIDDISQTDIQSKSFGQKVLECLCFASGLSYSWADNFEDAIDELRDISGRYHRLQDLTRRGEEKAAKYGKFIYQLEQGRVVVSRWIKDDGQGYRLTEILRI